MLSAFSQPATYPIETYTELPNPKPTIAANWSSTTDVLIAWGNTDTRYKKEEPASPVNSSKTVSLTAWKGERVSAQLVVSNKSVAQDLTYTVSELVNQTDNSQRITTDNIFSGFTRYVMTDQLNKDGNGACGYRNAADFDSSLVADPIDHYAQSISMKPMTTQGIWIRVSVPTSVPAGVYLGTVTVKFNGTLKETLALSITVQNRTLPDSKNWSFHLDLWQNPYSVARYYGVTPWSDAHLDALKKEMKPYADAGGKVITASIIYDPWGGQTYDKYDTMIGWTKKTDGNWSFDFSNFDKWVELMMSLGVDKQINCYSMIPWKLSFPYYDQTSASTKYVNAAPGDLAYEQLWVSMLQSFATHLKAKGWFEKTYISMDERALAAMLKAITVLHKADPDFKVSLAGAMHTELLDVLDDYCVALRMKFSDATIQKRKASGKVTTFYTSCEEPHPNTFTFCPPAENEWFGWYAAKAGLDGYLRWALNCWVAQPLTDSRFTAWAAGDTYLIYPGGRTSIRFERMTEGIQQYEKIRILKEDFTNIGYQTGLEQLKITLNTFNENTLLQSPAAGIIINAKKIIAQLSDLQISEKDLLKSAIDNSTAFKQNVLIGTEPGEYSNENTTILNVAITSATTVYNNVSASEVEWQQARLEIQAALSIYNQSVNMPKISDEKTQVWYSFYTPLRENKFVSDQGIGTNLLGESYTTNTDKFLWKIEKLTDGTMNIVSKATDGSIANSASYNTALSTQATKLTSNGWKFTFSGTNKYFIISSSAVQFNQTNTSLAYKIYNWGGGTEMSDTGNLYIIRTEKTSTTDVALTPAENLKIWIANNQLQMSDNTLSVRAFTTTGLELNRNKLPNQGLIIVKIPSKVIKLIL